MADDDELRLLDIGLGELVEAFAPSWSNIGAGLLLGVAACFGGAVVIWYPLHALDAANWDLPWYAAKPKWSWFGVGVFGLVGAAIFACGVAMLAFARWLAVHRVDVCAGGFRYVVPGRETAVRWGAVRGVLELVQYEHMVAHIHVLYALILLFRPKPVSWTYTATTWDGREFAFDGNSVRRLSRFGPLLREQANAHSVAWLTVDLRT